MFKYNPENYPPTEGWHVELCAGVDRRIKRELDGKQQDHVATEEGIKALGKNAGADLLNNVKDHRLDLVVKVAGEYATEHKILGGLNFRVFMTAVMNGALLEKTEISLAASKNQ